MSQTSHRVHGLAGDDLAPDWPALNLAELTALFARYRHMPAPSAIAWHSPRPLSAACLVQTPAGVLFVKRHHGSVRDTRMLSTEHRFMAHLRSRGLPVPRVHADADGHTAIALGEWTYEIHDAVAGDVYRDAISWSPVGNLAHAREAGRTLAALHRAAEGFDEATRDTHILVARSDLIAAADPVEALSAQLAARPGLAGYLRDRPWHEELRDTMAPWHARVRERILAQPTLWTHGDLHVSNLAWSSGADDATVSAVFDFGLTAPTFALFDLATAIERNAIAWLAIDTPGAAHADIALALIEGYAQVTPMDAGDLALLADLLPIVHVDFALSEVEYFHAITGSRGDADVAYHTFLRGHAAWFGTADGVAFRHAIGHFAANS